MNQSSPQSWKAMNRVPWNSIQKRLETIRPLKEDELELYEIAKDTETGEHYLHYSYLHRNIGAIGTGVDADEVFHQLMPLESDDVLALLFADEPYMYPEHWKRAFLRNGPEGDYVWFDPSYADEEAEYVSMGRDIAAELARFKEQGDLSEEAVRKLLQRLEGTSEDKG